MNDDIPNEQLEKKDNVTLTKESVRKIKGWFEQINAKKKIKIYKKDIVNWLVEEAPEVLPASYLNSIIDKFYDEEKFIRQLLRDVKKAKAEGTGEAFDVIVRPKKELKKEVTEEPEL